MRSRSGSNLFIRREINNRIFQAIQLPDLLRENFTNENKGQSFAGTSCPSPSEMQSIHERN